MPFQWGPVISGINQLLEQQRRTRDKAKMMEMIDTAKASGADVTIDFDAQGNIKPRITYKSKSKGDQISDIVNAMADVEKFKRGREEARMEAGMERTSQMIPPRLRGAITPEIFSQLPLRTSQFFRRGTYPYPSPATGEIEQYPIGDIGEDISGLFQAGKFPYRFGGRWATGTVPKGEAVRNIILNKISKGIPLSQGEQKIYEDVIKKGGTVENILSFLSGGTSLPQATTDRIRVRRKSDGLTGTIKADEFNTNLYERL